MFGYCCLVKHWGGGWGEVCGGVLTARVLSVKFAAVMQHTSGLRLNRRRCSQCCDFSSPVKSVCLRIHILFHLCVLLYANCCL